MLQEISSYNSLYLSDQRSFVRYFLTHQDSVGIDLEGDLFVTLHGIMDTSIITKGPSYRLEGRGDVAIVHGNAGGMGGKKYYEEIADAMKGERF